MNPQRIRQQNTRGSTKPAGAISVGHGTKYENPYRPSDLPAGGEPEENRGILTGLFRDMLNTPATRELARYPHPDEIRAALAGKDLMCQCPLDQPCHGDVLLAVANSTEPRAEGT